MEPTRKSPRTHSRKELAEARPPILVGCLMACAAVLLFAALSQLLNG